MNKFKDNLKRIRMTNLLSQTELAKKAGFESSHISHFERGRRFPSVQNLLKLSEALNCTTDELIK